MYSVRVARNAGGSDVQTVIEHCFIAASYRVLIRSIRIPVEHEVPKPFEQFRRRSSVGEPIQKIIGIFHTHRVYSGTAVQLRDVFDRIPVE